MQKNQYFLQNAKQNEMQISNACHPSIPIERKVTKNHRVKTKLINGTLVAECSINKKWVLRTPVNKAV